jgi:hypothetical protein
MSMVKIGKVFLIFSLIIEIHVENIYAQKSRLIDSSIKKGIAFLNSSDNQDNLIMILPVI